MNRNNQEYATKCIADQKIAIEKAKELVKVIEAFVEGKPIQVHTSNKELWIDCTKPIRDWLSYQYRIKPEQEFKPFTYENFPLVEIWIKYKSQESDMRASLVLSVNTRGVSIYSGFLTYKSLLTQCLMTLDSGVTWQPVGQSAIY